MTKTFRDKIIELRNSEEDLFYNTSGNPEAYKLGVKHLSSAPAFGYAILRFKEVIPIKIIFLVDFENEIILEIEDAVKIIPIKFLP